jgi:hypothetical protein
VSSIHYSAGVESFDAGTFLAGGKADIAAMIS